MQIKVLKKPPVQAQQPKFWGEPPKWAENFWFPQKTNYTLITKEKINAKFSGIRSGALDNA